MLVSASILISVCLAITLGDNKEPELTSLQHQYHPYHQHRASNYHNRRSFQRGLDLHHNYRSPAKLSKLPSYGVKFQPKIVPQTRREDRKVLPVFPGHQNRNTIPNQENLHLHTTYHRRPSAHRAQRKIEIEHSKLDNQLVKDKSPAKKTSVKAHSQKDATVKKSPVKKTRVRSE